MLEVIAEGHVADVADVADRAREFREFRVGEPAKPPTDDLLDPAAIAGTSPVGKDSQRLLTLLSAFMEESNIRWGEVVGGLLIVGCSLALVLSFWSSIAERPLLKFGLFTGVTALLFAVGLHAERHWKLPTSARGLLVIATLLIPLNFLAVASLSRGALSESAMGILGELLAIGLFAPLTYLAGRALVSRAPAALAAGVLVPSVTMLLTRRLVDPGGMLLGTLALGATPLLAQVGGVGALLRRVRREPEIDEPVALDMLRLLGLTTFAVALALGLLVARGGSPTLMLQGLAPLAPLAGLSALATGLLLWRRTTAPEWIAYRTTGTAIAAGGALVMLAGVALAWPDASRVIPVASINFVVLTAAALIFEVPAAHVLAGACLILAYLLGWPRIAATFGWNVLGPKDGMGVILSGRAGASLLPMEVAFGVAASLGLRRGRRFDAQAFAVVSVITAALGLVLVTWHGFGRMGASVIVGWIYAAHALAAFAGAAWFGRNPLVEGTNGATETRVLGWCGSALVLLALVQALVYAPWARNLSMGWVLACLSHASLMLASLTILARARPETATGQLLRAILDRSALVTSIAAATGIAIALPFARSSVLAADLLFLSLVWLAIAWRRSSPRLFAAFQASMAGAVVLGVDIALVRLDGFAHGSMRWLDPWSLQAEAFALGLLCLGWIGIRLGVRAMPPESSGRASGLLDPPWTALDRVFRGVVVAVLIFLAVYGAWPGVARELSSANQGWGTGREVPPASAFEFAGVPHAHALGAGSWALLGLVLVMFLAGQRERFRRLDVLGVLVVAAMAVPLWAGTWEGDMASASALRWGSAAYLLGASCLIWNRAWVARWAPRIGWRIDPGGSTGLSDLATGVVMTLGILPVAVATAIAVGMIPTAASMVGPEPRSFFGRMGDAVSYVTPLVIVAATLAGYAARERSSPFAFAAVMVLNLAATGGTLLVDRAGGLNPDEKFLVRLALLNAIVASACALTWIGTVALWRRRRGGEESTPPDTLLTIAMALGVALSLVAVIAGTSAVFFEPRSPVLPATVAGPWGWGAMLLSAGAFVAWARSSGRRMGADDLGVGLGAFAGFLALGLTFRDRGDWLTYHGVLAGQALVAWALPMAAWQRAGLRLSGVAISVREGVVRWATVSLGLVALFAIRAYWSDPQSPWWTVSGLAVMAPLAAVLALWSGRRGFLTVGVVLLNLAATCGWCSSSLWSGLTGAGAALIDLLNVNVLALALPVVAWARVERRLRDDGRFPLHRAAAWVAVSTLAIVVPMGLTADAAGAYTRPNVVLGWLALGSTAVAMAAGLWDPRPRAPVAGLYLLGLCAAGWSVHQFHLPPDELAMTGTVVLSAYSVVTSFLWSRHDALRSMADRLAIARPDVDDPIASLLWLSPANLALAAIVIVLAFGSILTRPELVMRSMAANAVMAEVLAAGLLARGERRLRLEFVALSVGALGMVAWGWAGIAPGSANGLLDRLVVVWVALVVGSVLYGLGPGKLLPRAAEWNDASRRLVPILLGLGALVLASVLAVELFDRANGDAIAMSIPSIAAVALGLLAAAVAAIVAAVVPGRDPLGLSERGRTAYVYGCEALLALTALHVRLTLPWLFSGFFARYAPLIVLGVSFVGVGLGELFRRQGRLVLAEPLERTGALLPVLPLLAAFWSAPLPVQDVTFLIMAGGLYTLLSRLRSSPRFGAVAILAYNGALWVLLGHREGLSLFQHPQLWVIPPAFCILVGAYMNRDRLSASRLAAIRQAAALAIYVSSTADIVLNGVAQAPWLPLVLAALSIAGIFAGIALRVRGFLLLGLGFLGLSLFTIIWYAAVDLRQTWLWSVCGIVAGILILALFALFEKKKEEVLRAVNQFKEWNA